MPFLNKLKKEFEVLNLSDRLQGQQGASVPPSSHENTYGTHTTSNSSYQYQLHDYTTYPANDQQSYPGAPHFQNSIHAQHSSAYQPYDGQQPHYELQHNNSQVRPNYHSPSGTIQQVQGQQQPTSQLSSDPSRQYMLASPAAVAPYPSPNGQSAQVYSNQYAYASTENAVQPEPQKGSSSHTYLAAAGGFAAGGIAGYFIKDRIDARKAKKRHGRSAADFSDFSSYPNMEVDLECNICDQVISGPYAHCKKCDGGNYDICRDCLAQGQTCDGRGKHDLVKVYPKYFCDICDIQIVGQFYHCARCNNSDWDICQTCLDKGYSCLGRDRGETHDLTKLYIPVVKHEKKGRYGGSSSSTSSSSDSN